MACAHGHDAAAAPATQAPRRRPWRWAAWAAGVLLLALLALGGGAAWLLGGESGNRWLLSHAPGATVQGQHGRLTGGPLAIERIVWQSGTLKLEIEGLAWKDAAWRPRPYAGAWMGLALTDASARRITLTTLPPAQPTPRAQVPASLRLPLELVARNLTVQTLQVGSGAPVTDLHLDLHLGADAGAQHRIDDLALVRSGTAVRGAVAIATAAPLNLQGTLGAATSPSDAQAWQLGARLGGTLARVTADASMALRTGGRAQARLAIAPFEAWPLDGLEASWTNLDLAAFGGPHSALSGSAATRGQGRAMALALRIDNALPGAWDASRLPLQSAGATLQRSADGGRITLTDIDVALAGARPAGRLQGTASWDAKQLSLQASLSAVQLAQLYTAAPQAALQGTLDGSVLGLPLPGQPPAGGAQAGGLQGQLALHLASAPRKAGRPLRLDGEAKFTRSPQGLLAVEVPALVLADAGGRLQAGARWRQTSADAWQLDSQGEAKHLDPSAWLASRDPRAPDDLNARWQASLRWQPGPSSGDGALQRAAQALSGNAEATIQPSRVGGLPLQGEATLQAAQSLSLRATLDAGGNGLQAELASPRSGAHWQGQARVQAARLASLAPLKQWLPKSAAAWLPTDGSVQAQASLQHRADQGLASEGSFAVQGLRSALLQVGHANGRWAANTQRDSAPLMLALDAQAIASGTRRLDALKASVNGTLASHAVHVEAASPLRPPDWLVAAAPAAAQAPPGSRFALDLQGRWQPARDGSGRWSASVPLLAAVPRTGGAAWLSAQGLQAQVELGADHAPRTVALAPGRIAMFGGALRWREARWQAPASARQRPRIALDAELEPMRVAPLLARLQPQFGWRGDLAIAGRAVLHSASELNADLSLQRQSGDLALSVAGQTRALGLGAARVALQARGGRWHAQQLLAGSLLGELQGSQSTVAAADGLLPDAAAPLQGSLQLRMPDLSVWAPWLPLGWRVGGQAQAQAALGGRVAAPTFSGRLAASRLDIDNLFEGVHLRDGELALALQGDHATLERMSLRAGDGVLRATGSARLGAQPSAQLHAVAERFRALDRVDRKVALSGSADARFDARRLVLNGQVRVDEGLVDVSQADAPALGRDVRVVNRPVDLRTARAAPAGAARAGTSGTAAPSAKSALVPDVHLDVDLGNALKLHGRGLDAVLRGRLAVTTPNGQPALTGSVRADGGTYAAYGQNLLIERGTLRFDGEISNPSLDVLALRQDLDTRVGVQVSGHAADPRVRLYSEPSMSDMDTLTWLVLGRAPEGLGRDDTALLQRAALSLMAGEKDPNKGFMKRLGLDEFSVHQAGAGDTASTIVSLGKQVSRRLFVGYEQAMAGTGGAWQLVYRVFGRLTVRLRAGEDESLDAVWSWRWD